MCACTCRCLQITQLAAEGKYDLVVIESTGARQAAADSVRAIVLPCCLTKRVHAGISEPMQVAETFTFPIPTSELPPDTREQLLKLLPAAAKPSHGCGRPGAPCNDDGGRRTRSADKAPKEQQGGKDDNGSHANGLSELALSEYVRLDTCVTVVDASVFFDNLHSLEELHDR